MRISRISSVLGTVGAMTANLSLLDPETLASPYHDRTRKTGQRLLTVNSKDSPYFADLNCGRHSDSTSVVCRFTRPVFRLKGKAFRHCVSRPAGNAFRQCFTEIFSASHSLY